MAETRATPTTVDVPAEVIAHIKTDFIMSVTQWSDFDHGYHAALKNLVRKLWPRVDWDQVIEAIEQWPIDYGDHQIPAFDALMREHRKRPLPPQRPT